MIVIVANSHRHRSSPRKVIDSSSSVLLLQIIIFHLPSFKYLHTFTTPASKVAVQPNRKGDFRTIQGRPIEMASRMPHNRQPADD